jgi:hypothetical protein
MMKAMKLFLCALLLFPLNTIVAQENSFLDGRKWVVHEYRINPFDDYNDVVTFIAYGDTTLSGLTYKKVYSIKCDSIDSVELPMLIRRDGNKIYHRYGSYGKWNPDTLVFDEDWQQGDNTIFPLQRNFDGTIDVFAKIFEIGYLQGRKSWDVNGMYTWIQDVGFVKTRLFFDSQHELPGANLYNLICCVEANGDTLYVNRALLYLTQTGISSAVSDNIICQQSADGLSVNIGADIPQWSATLYNSNGICVAQKEGAGSEIFLPADSKGTHILVVKAGGRVVKKKIALK